jgi:hypothetical protein
MHEAQGSLALTLGFAHMDLEGSMPNHRTHQRMRETVGQTRRAGEEACSC